MALSDNKVIRKKTTPYVEKLKVVNGDVHIYRGANLEYELGNVGYVQPATTDSARPTQPKFAGIALQELNKASADNGTDGTFDIEVLMPGSGEIIEMDITSNITIANEKAKVYMDGDDKVDIASGVVNTTDGMVGIIRKFISTNKAWVQLTEQIS